MSTRFWRRFRCLKTSCRPLPGSRLDADPECGALRLRSRQGKAGTRRSGGLVRPASKNLLYAEIGRPGRGNSGHRGQPQRHCAGRGGRPCPAGMDPAKTEAGPCRALGPTSDFAVALPQGPGHLNCQPKRCVIGGPARSARMRGGGTASSEAAGPSARRWSFNDGLRPRPWGKRGSALNLWFPTPRSMADSRGRTGTATRA